MAMRYIPIFLIFLTSFCKSDNQLTHTKPLIHGDTLISKSGDFALGFFSPTSSNKSFYLGIWYHSLPGPYTVVWVANRDNPISTPLSGMLTVTNNSQMVLYDSKGRNIWMSANDIIAGTAIAHAELLNSGNFVLRLPNTTNIWQSFDHPTDTILPTMRFLVSYKTQVVERIVAWKGSDDPSSGDFSLSSDPSYPTLQFVIWHGSRPYCRTIVLNDASVISGGTYLSNTRSILYEAAVNSGDEFYFLFTISDNSPFTRITLDYTGKLKALSWDSRSSSWALIGEHPTAACDLYASCGPFSYCNFALTIPACQCLDGFEPVDSINFSKGCQRKQVLKCGKQSSFASLPGMKVPDNFLHIRNKSFDECVAECSRNCSCTAYAYANLSKVGAMSDPSRCLVWSGELTDVGKATAGENLYFRLADSLDDKRVSSVKIILPITACLLLVLCIALVWMYKYRAGKRRNKENKKKMILGYLSTSNELGGENAEFPFVSFEDILSATNFFANSNLLGQGGFGKVYKVIERGTYSRSKHVLDRRKNKPNLLCNCCINPLLTLKTLFITFKDYWENKHPLPNSPQLS